MKIYISPSDQVRNLYSYGGTNEAAQCRKIAAACKSALERCGFEVRTNFADGSDAMYERVRESNAWGADVHLCIHTNAGGGSGCVVFVSKLDDRHKKYGQAVYDAVSAITVANERYGVRSANFYEIKKTSGLCVYCECEFHDNARDARWIVEHTADIGEALCRGICNATGIKYIPEKQEDDDMTQEQFNEMADKYFAAVGKKPGSAWSEPARKWAIDNGIFKGDGAGNFTWQAPITREQMAQVLMSEWKLIEDLADKAAIDTSALFEEFKRNLKISVEVQ